MGEKSEFLVFYLTKEMRDQFIKTRILLDNVLETFEIIEDETLNGRKQSETDFEEGRL